MTLLVLAFVGLFFAAIPAALFFANLRLFRPLAPATVSETPLPPVSVLIPARDEEASIAAAVESVLANRGVEFEVIVLDDHSTDETASLVRAIAARDSRARVEPAPPLPPGWCGKQHACDVLSRLARHDLLVWMDADVRLAPDALARVASATRGRPDLGLLGGFPRQLTGTFVERLLIPLIHFVLLSFLPIARMRSSTHPAYAAGCGQLFASRRAAYERVGGHAAIRASRHDGITLPRAFRAAGIATDVFDATDLAECRMYRSAAETWRGLTKNATEGMAAPRAIGAWTAILLAGQVVPPGVLLASAVAGRATSSVTIVAALAATACSLAVRLAAATRFRQPARFAFLHPAAILALLALQWNALGRRVRGVPTTWKGRGHAR